MPKVKISVILPTYNGRAYLQEAINSVLAQQSADFELLLVDDGSTDPATAAILSAQSDPRVRVIRVQHSGRSAATNAGLAQATGEYVARIDDDDIWLNPAKLSIQATFLDLHPTHVIVGTNIAVIEAETKKELYQTNYFQNDEEIRQHFFGQSPFAHSSVLTRRSAVMAAGSYDERLPRIEDYDLWFRLGAQGPMANLPEVMVAWRAPSPKVKNIARLRLRDHYTKLYVLWRYRKNYPNFWPPFLTELIKIFPYALAAAFSGKRTR